MFTKPTSNKFYIIFTTVLIAIGLALALYQFFFNRSIWGDEATLTLNIIHRTPSGLLKPLDYKQVAPILFLEVEHFCFYLIPNSEFGLRLFPLSAYFASIYLLYKILSHFVKNKITILLGLALFVFNSVVIYYSSEAKQYMTDVFTGLLIYFFLLKDYKSQTNKLIILGCIGALSIFLSNVSLIVLSTASVFLIATSPKNKELLKLLMVFIPWGISFCFYYVFFISHHPSRGYMIEFWSKEKAFMPLNPLSADFYRFLAAKFSMIFYFLFGYGSAGKILLPLFLILGLFNLYSSQKKAYVFLIILPTVIQLILSAFKLYPFEKRLILFQYPILIMGIAAGFDFLFDLSKQRDGFKGGIVNHALVILLSIYLLVFVYFNGFPILHYEIKQSLKYVEHKVKNDQSIYVYQDLVPAFYFYRDINYSNFKNAISYGSSNQDVDESFNQVTKLEGKVWLLVYNGSQFIVDKLDKENCKKLDSFQYGNVSAYLYDFSTLKNSN